MEKITDLKGAFVGSLVRNNTKIKQDRAIVISEEAQIKYKRKVEDLEIKIKQMRRDRENMLDMSPTDTTSLIMASDFDGDNFVNRDLKLGVDIRNLEIQMEIAKDRYSYLFEGTSELAAEEVATA